MIPPVDIDLTEFTESFILTQGEIDTLKDNVVSTLASEFMSYWEHEAVTSLKTSRSEYIRNLYMNKVDTGVYEVGLRGEFPNMVESGVPIFDMKIGFSRSMKKKLKKDGGWYLTIPFRFSTPDAIGDSGAFSGGRLPKEVYNVASKKYKTSLSDLIGGGMKKSKALRLKEIPMQFRTSNVATRKQTSIYEGLERVGSKNNHQWMNFRRVSDKSPENSWIYPGLEARNLAEAAFSKFETIIPRLVDMVSDNWLEEFNLS